MVTGVPRSEFLDHSRPTLPESVWLVLASQGKALGLGTSPASLRQRETRPPGLDGKLQAGLVLELGKRRRFGEASPRGVQPLDSGEREPRGRTCPCRRHFPGNRPGLALSSFWRRSGGISCRWMPWLLALQGEGGLRGRNGSWEGRAQVLLLGGVRHWARGREKGRALRSELARGCRLLTPAAGLAVWGWAC